MPVWAALIASASVPYMTGELKTKINWESRFDNNCSDKKRQALDFFKNEVDDNNIVSSY